MTDIPDSFPEEWANIQVEPDAPHPNKCNEGKSLHSRMEEAKRQYLKEAAGTPWEAFAEAIVEVGNLDTKDKVVKMLEILPLHPTVACAALSHFIFDINRGMIAFHTTEQHEAVLKAATDAIGIFAHLADPHSLP